VSLSPAEAVAMAIQIDRLAPRQRTQTLDRFEQASQRMLSSPPPLLGTGATAGELSRWYRGLNLDCPLLVDGDCLIYQHRPLVCREHLVNCGPWSCAQPVAGAAPLPMPTSAAEALAWVCERFDSPHPEAIVLPLALDWVRSSGGRLRRRHSAAALIAALAEGFRQAALRRAA
jgi:Fe-S-cluster containining protein